MRMVTRCLTLCAIGGLFVVSACGQDEGENGGTGGGTTGGGGLSGPKPTAATGTLEKATATKSKDEFQKAARQGNPVLLDRTSLTSSGLETGTTLALEESTTSPDALKSCTQTEGDTADADADGWAVSVKSVFDCDLSNLAGASGTSGTEATSSESPSFSFKLKGGTTITDADDTKAFPKAGFSFSYDDFRMSISGLGGATTAGASGAAAEGDTATSTGASSFDVAINGSVVVTGDASELKGQTSFQTSMKVGDTEMSRITQWIDSTSKPDDAADPKKSGSVSFSGFLQMFDDKGAETTLKVSTSGLTYAKTCGTEFGGYKTGTITYEAASGKVEYVFADCKGTLKFNGAAL